MSERNGPRLRYAQAAWEIDCPLPAVAGGGRAPQARVADSIRAAGTGARSGRRAGAAPAGKVVAAAAGWLLSPAGAHLSPAGAQSLDWQDAATIIEAGDGFDLTVAT